MQVRSGERFVGLATGNDSEFQRVLTGRRFSAPNLLTVPADTIALFASAELRHQEDFAGVGAADFFAGGDAHDIDLLALIEGTVNEAFFAGHG
jgi:hypothetical protein